MSFIWTYPVCMRRPVAHTSNWYTQPYRRKCKGFLDGLRLIIGAPLFKLFTWQRPKVDDSTCPTTGKLFKPVSGVTIGCLCSGGGTLV
jgi:hypothetical protein